jgi:hypothetical protein
MYFKTAFFILAIQFLCTELSAQINCLSADCKSGKGKADFFQDNQKIGTYEGIFMNGKFMKGNMTFTNKGTYYGEWRDNNFQGFGIKTLADATILTGKWHKGELTDSMDATSVLAILKNNLSGILNCEEGDCNNNPSKCTDLNANRYSGGFKNGFYEGYGEIFFNNGDFYRGNWKEGNFHGKGAYYDTKGNVIKGDWEYGIFTANPTEIYALVVGIAAYQNFQKLNFSSSDAEAFYNHLKSPSGALLSDENAEILLDEEATTLKIKNKMADLFAMADTNDMVIFYFAGHGIDGAFLPVDYDGFNNYIDHRSVINAMQDSEAKYKLIIADACHSGSFAIKFDEYRKNGNQFPLASVRGGKSINDQLKDFYKSFSNTKKGLAIISSSAADEISLEAEKLKQGVFSYFLIKGLKGEADFNNNDMITAKELFEYIAEKVDEFTFGYQTPNFMGRSEGETNFSDIPIGIKIQSNNVSDDK